MAKVKATEMLAIVADEAIQIHGGMGLMDELPLERIWRDARVERIWEGTSEIQRHIISRACFARMERNWLCGQVLPPSVLPDISPTRGEITLA